MSQVLPRVFISCVSDEFRTLRRRVADAVRFIGWEPVYMEAWPTGEGELLDWHRREIDSCQGLIQIAGIAYGAEPPHHDPAAHGIPEAPQRYSYTQFEFHYALARGKKTWLILPGPACTRDTPADLLDLPKDPLTGQPDPAIPGAVAYQAERRALQARYIQWIKDTNYLRHAPANDDRLDILILKLRKLPAEYRGDLGMWMMGIKGDISTVRRALPWMFVLMVVILGLVISIMVDGRKNRELIESLLEQRRFLAEDYRATGRDIGEVPPQEVESRLAERLGLSVPDVRSAIEDGKKSSDALTRGRAELLAGNYDRAIAIATDARQHLAGDPSRLIEADKIIAEAHNTKAEYPQALEARRRIAGLIDREVQPEEWIDAQDEIAALLYHLSLHGEANELLREAIDFGTEKLGTGHPVLAVPLTTLGVVLEAQGNVAEAEQMYQRALPLSIARFGTGHVHVAVVLNNWAYLLKARGLPAQAEPLVRRSLAIAETVAGPDDRFTGTRVNMLAAILDDQGKLDEAEPLYRRALAIARATLPPGHPTISIRLNNLGFLLEKREKWDEAEDHFRQAVQVSEPQLQDGEPNAAGRLANLGKFLTTRGDLAEARPLLERAVSIYFAYRKREGNPFRGEDKAVAGYTTVLTATGHTPDQIDAEIRRLKQEAGLQE